MKLYLKRQGDVLCPDNDESLKFIHGMNGDVVSCEIKKVRNYGFHKKFFSLLTFAFDNWEPVNEHKGEVVSKNFDKFRSDMLILCGHYEVVAGIKGARAQAKSISFSNMHEEQFNEVYSTMIDVILSHVLTNYTKNDLNDVINKIVGYV